MRADPVTALCAGMRKFCVVSVVGLLAAGCVVARRSAAVQAREAALFRRFFGSSASSDGPSPDAADPAGTDNPSDPETDFASGAHTFHASSQAFLDSLRDRA